MKCKICGMEKVQYQEVQRDGTHINRLLCPREIQQKQASRFARQLDDYEALTCPECGSSLDWHGDCRNTNCGNSRYQGMGWQ